LFNFVFWDLMDLYVDLRHFKFLSNSVFGSYYVVRAFFCIVLLEVGFAITLFDISNKTVMAVIVPIGFSAIFQNLVVKAGGVESNIGEVFDRFKFNIKKTLIANKILDKVTKSRQLLMESNVPNETLLETCRFYAEEKKDYEELIENTTDLTEKDKRMEYIIWLIDHSESTDICEQLIAESQSKNRKRELKPVKSV